MASKTRPSSRSRHAARNPRPLWALVWSPSAGTRVVSNIDEFKAAYADETSLVWVDLQDTDRDLLMALSKILGIHPLIAEDILESNQRAKVELTGDLLHVVMFRLTYEGEVVAHELDLVLGKRFLLSAHDAD